MSKDPEYGGFTMVARALSAARPERGRPYTRQAIHSWWSRRAINNFPTRHSVATATDGKTIEQFKIAEVITWFDNYTPSSGGRKLGGTNRPKAITHVSQQDVG